jgi:hypothetical protein
MGMGKNVSSQETKVTSKATSAVLWSTAAYLVWTLATYTLEGRINLLQQPTVAGRYTYVLIANVLIGTIGAIWMLRSLLSSQGVSLPQMGFRPLGRTVFTIVIALVIGVVYLSLLRPAASSSLVIINGYAQVLTVSIAEIIVCWVLVGASFESLAKSKGKLLSLLAGILAATILFSVYHVGHSAPFNQIQMMLILLMPGILTSLFYFISREIYATILFHNFQGTFGVLSNLKNPELLDRPLYPLYLLALVAVLALIGADLFLARRATR